MTAATLLTLRVPDFDAAIRSAVEPRLSDRPVVVATSFKPLGRVLAASLAARAAGVEADMPYPVARARCPDGAFFVPDKELAGRAIRAMVAKAAEYSPLVEPAGDGRILLDTRGTEALWGAGLDVAEKLRRDLRERLHLPAAAGLAARRPWSLLASRAAGDDGSWWVAPGQEDTFLDLTPTAWIDGISLRTRERLAELNIHRVGQLRQFLFPAMAQQFGAKCAKALRTIVAPDAWDAAPVSCHEQAAAAGRTVRVAAAIPEATASPERLRVVARTLAAQVSAELRRRGEGTALLRATLLYADGAANTAQKRTGGFIQAEDALVALAEGMLPRIFSRRVRVSRFWLDAEKLGEPMRQGVLFAADSGDRPKSSDADVRLWTTVDRIRRRYGEDGIVPGNLLPTVKPQRGIA